MSMRAVRAIVAVSAGALASAVFASDASACGVSSPGAPAGVCDASDAIDEKVALARSHRLGASGSLTSTALFLSDGSRVSMERQAANATVSFRLDKKTTVELGGGAILGGSLGDGPSRVSLRPGGLGSVSTSYRLLDQRGVGAPFVLLTAVAAFMVATTSPQAGFSGSNVIAALDFRLGAIVGTTLGKPHGVSVTPYLAAQLFGGPVFWKYAGAGVTGTDVHKYAVGGGLAASFFGRLGLFLGGSVLGENSFTFGASVSF